MSELHRITVDSEKLPGDGSSVGFESVSASHPKASMLPPLPVKYVST